MKQKEFTDYIIPKLIDRILQFEGCLTVKPNDIVDIDYKSSKGRLTLWVTTQDMEVTIGFTGDYECDWHIHRCSFGVPPPEEEVSAVVELIRNILTDKEPIVYSNLTGYSLTDNVNEINNNLDKDEVIQILKWSDL